MEQKKLIKSPPAAFLKADLMIQSILGILILITLVLYPIAMLLLIPYGAWQVVSGIVGALYGSKWRMVYLGIVTAYFSMYAFADLMDSKNGMNEIMGLILMGIYVVPPLVLGIGYYIKTKKEMSGKEGVKPKWEDMDDILDLEMV